MEKKYGLGVFEKYLTLWVAACIITGIAIGKYLPAFPAALGKLEYANVSLPVAVLIWLMIYPMMLKIDFQSIKNVGKNPKGLVVTCVSNWLIKPFTMFGIAWLFLMFVFGKFIPSDLANQYLAGCVLLGAAPCTAMVFVWSYLTKGDAAYTLLQVAVKRPHPLGGFRAYGGFSLGCGWYFYSLEYVDVVGSPICGNTFGGRYPFPLFDNSQKRQGIFLQCVHSPV